MSAHLSDSEILRALSQGEGQFREFKSAWDRSSDPPRKLKWRSIRDKIADVIAAFANADGGLLLVGVEDDGQPSGHGYSHEATRHADGDARTSGNAHTATRPAIGLAASRRGSP